MVARRHSKRIKGGSKTLRGVKPAKENADKMDIDKTLKPVQPGIKKQICEFSEDNLHKIAKKGKRKRYRKRSKKVKLQLLGKELIESGSEDPAKKQNSSQSLRVEELYEKHPYGISLAGIPRKLKVDDLKEIINKYKDLGIKASALTRKSTRNGACQVFHLYFDSEEAVKDAILLGPTSFLGKPLMIRTDPVRMIYISGIPLDKDAETIVSDLKEALGPSIYHIDVSTDTKNGEMLGHAIAYVMDGVTHEILLNNHSLNLWDSVQHCCRKQDFYDRFVIYIVSGCVDKSQKVLKKLVEKITKENYANVAVDHSNIMYCLDEAAVKSIMEKPVKVIDGKNVVLSREPVIDFYIRNIQNGVQKPQLKKLLHGLNVHNLVFNPEKNKAAFSVPVNEAGKCQELHGKKFNGCNLIVYQGGGTQFKSPNNINKKKFQGILNKSSLTPGKKLRFLKKLSQVAKQSKPGKTKKISVRIDKTKNKLSKGKAIGKNRKVSTPDKNKNSTKDEKTDEGKPVVEKQNKKPGVKVKRQRKAKKN